MTNVFSVYFCDRETDKLCVTERSEAVETIILMKICFLDCFVVPPRNDAKRQKSPASKRKPMKTYLKSLIVTFAFCIALTACDSPTKRMEQAQALYKEGVQLREQRRSEEAAEKFLQGLAIVQRSKQTTETIRLEGQLCDNLGAMYLKHELFEDAFKQHQQALKYFKQTADSTGIMNAYRNSGRAIYSSTAYERLPSRPARPAS